MKYYTALYAGVSHLGTLNVSQCVTPVAADALRYLEAQSRHNRGVAICTFLLTESHLKPFRVEVQVSHRNRQEKLVVTFSTIDEARVCAAFLVSQIQPIAAVETNVAVLSRG